jgi:hypothetical protein
LGIDDPEPQECEFAVQLDLTEGEDQYFVNVRVDEAPESSFTWEELQRGAEIYVPNSVFDQ